MSRGARLDLHDADTDRQPQQAEPLDGAQFFPQHQHAESGRGEDLHLVRHLEGGDVQIRSGDELQVVLDDVQDRRDGELPAVRAEHLAAQLPKAPDQPRSRA